MKSLSKRQQEILNVSKQSFVQKGFTETSVRDIAEDLGIQAASLYNHFRSKEEILLAICSDIRLRFNALKENLRAADMPPERKFFEFVKGYLTEILTDVQAFEIYLGYWNVNENFRQHFEEDRRDFLLFVKELFDEMGVTSDPKVFVADAPVLMVLTSLNLAPRLLANKENPDVEAVVNDFLSRLTQGFHSEKKQFN